MFLSIAVGLVCQSIEGLAMLLSVSEALVFASSSWFATSDFSSLLRSCPSAISLGSSKIPLSAIVHSKVSLVKSRQYYKCIRLFYKTCFISIFRLILMRMPGFLRSRSCSISALIYSGSAGLLISASECSIKLWPIPASLFAS